MAAEHANATTLTHDAIVRFASEWVAASNRCDVDGVLHHFKDDAKLTSPLVGKHAGSFVLRDKASLAAYWRFALELLDVLEFTIDHASRDETQRESNGVYEANLNGVRKFPCENMTFDETGRQIRGAAFYGAEI